MKISKLVLYGALVVLMITSFAVPGFAENGKSSPLYAAASGRGGSGDVDNLDPLVIYADAFAGGIVLDYNKAEGLFLKWSEPYSLKRLDGLAWTLRGNDGDGDEQDFKFTLVLENDALVITYLDENGGGDGN